LKSGTKLQHGDILLSTPEKFIIVEQLPEKVISIRIKKKESKNLLKLCMMIGHIIGNRHRPIAIDEKGTISFPIQADSEIDVFRRLLHSIMDHIELTAEERIFQSEQGMDVHEH
ncbi:MAG: Urease accessory protein, partial [Nitrosopumilaceae archaeon]